MNRLAILVPLLLLPACEDEKPDPSTPSYWADVAPLLNGKCVKCHQDHSVAPFALDSFAAVRERADRIVGVTRAGIMPPFLITHDRSCGDFHDEEALTAAEIDTIERWVREGMREGQPIALTRPRPNRLEGGEEFSTPTIAPVAQGGDLAEFDEYRCFPLEMGLQKDGYINGYEVTPGNASIVHHVIGFLVDPTRKSGRPDVDNGQLMKALDDADPDRPGWPCFGMAGEGLMVDAQPVNWAPGIGPLEYPAGTGIPVRKTDKLVVQVHYNLAHPVAGATDSTRVRIRFADSVERKVVFALRDGLLSTIFEPPAATLPPGRKAVDYTWSMKGTDLGLGPVPYADVLAIAPHMHERGVSQEVRMGPAGGPDGCAARLPRWDFHWQRAYFYRGTLPRLTPDTQLQVTCTYDTSRDENPVKPGWGTRNEMCLPGMMLMLPPGF